MVSMCTAGRSAGIFADVRYRRGAESFEVVQDGKQLVVDGKVRRFVSPEHAATQLAKLVGEKLAAGFAEVPEAPPPPPPPRAAPGEELRDATLEAAILDDPYDAGAYGVYGDWLLTHGDPRGELIALMLGLERKLSEEQTTRTRSQIRRHLLEHSDQFYGRLAKLVGSVHDYEQQVYTWRFGFIHRIATRDPSLGLAALEHPSGRFVAELALDNITQHVVTVIMARARRSLRVLDLRRGRTDDPEPDERSFDFAPLIAALPQLRRLTISVPRFELGALSSPVLERAEIRGWELSASCVRSVATAAWPALERLDLQLGNGSARFEDLQPLFARTDLARLTHLKIRGCNFTGAVVAALAKSPLAAQLVVLDLTNGTLIDADAAILGGCALPQLRELWVNRNRISHNGLAPLRSLAKHFLFDAMRATEGVTIANDPLKTNDPVERGDDDERYVVIRE